MVPALTQPVVIRELITDSGRTSNLVGNSRLQAKPRRRPRKLPATTCCSRRIVRISRFSMGRLVVRVAAETVGARQLLSDRVTELAKNNLRSQLDASFADVNVSEAKLRIASGFGVRVT